MRTALWAAPRQSTRAVGRAVDGPAKGAVGGKVPAAKAPAALATAVAEEVDALAAAQEDREMTEAVVVRVLAGGGRVVGVALEEVVREVGWAAVASANVAGGAMEEASAAVMGVATEGGAAEVDMTEGRMAADPTVGVTEAAMEEWMVPVVMVEEGEAEATMALAGLGKAAAAVAKEAVEPTVAAPGVVATAEAVMEAVRRVVACLGVAARDVEAPAEAAREEVRLTEGRRVAAMAPAAMGQEGVVAMMASARAAVVMGVVVSAVAVTAVAARAVVARASAALEVAATAAEP